MTGPDLEAIKLCLRDSARSPYGPETLALCETMAASAVVLLVVDGNRGHGAALALDEAAISRATLKRTAEALRFLASDIERLLAGEPPS